MCKVGQTSSDWVSLFSYDMLTLRNVLGQDMTCLQIGGELVEASPREGYVKGERIQSVLGRKEREQLPRAGSAELQLAPKAGLD